MSFFERILSDTRAETEAHKQKTSLKNLKRRFRDCGPTKSLRQAIDSPFSGLIAEIKLRSPSMGSMLTTFEANRISQAPTAYERHPIVKAVSVLTNQTHFGGSIELLREIRRKVRKPILRKDFITDEYQVWQARVIGADALLLMACAIKDRSKFQDLYDLATSIGLEVLCEIHSEEEFELLPPNAQICGVNCRKFESDAGFWWSKFSRMIKRDSTTNLDRFSLLDSIPDGMIRVAESGISPASLCGVSASIEFNAALVGTSLLKSDRGIFEELNAFQAAFEESRTTDTQPANSLRSAPLSKAALL